ncbi:hypothetical protein CC2G_013402 [Coprinopsis cinerea AmutBmut pab1-1]|nr:hypothetical protein CC2G_013402 [Coprinopsis cinerea AmutBmut pab1-1]
MKKDKTLPGREETFTYKGSPVKTGKVVRTAVINTLWFKQANPNRPVTEHPKTFLNSPQDGKKIFPSMQGTGHEFPVSDRKPGGFQGKGNVGAMRVITQPTKDGGTKYMGLISHDPTLKQSKDDPQRNFHHLVLPGPPLPKKPKKQGKGK